MDYPKMLRALIRHFIEMEGTDYLSEKGVVERFGELTAEENAALTEARDAARTSIGWCGYTFPANQF